MKIPLITLILLSIAVIPSHSQTTYGIKGGLNISTIGGDAQYVDPKLGFHVGLFAHSKVSPTFAVQPEILFSRQGAQSSENSKEKVNYDYLTLPLMFNFYASQNFYFMTGPQMGILVGAKYAYEDQTVSVKDELNVIDLGLGAGIGVDSEDVVFSARYYLGLTDTSNYGHGTFPNRVFQLSIGFKLR